MSSESRSTIQVAVVVGRPGQSVGTHAELSRFARKICPADTVEQALTLIKTSEPDLVLVTETIPVEQTLILLEVTKASHCSVPVVVLSADPDVDLAVKLVRSGAYDVVRSPLDRISLGRLVEGMTTESSRTRSRTGRYFCDDCPPGVTFVGQSPALRKVLETLRLVAESRCNPVLILGETGTGKELAARSVHAWRCGGDENFVAVNCAALTANLLESELFGHVRGAFTGADREKTGLFELAGEGSIFLDEISEMAPELQAKLLRVLQERTFRKVGGTRDITCTATVIASSNRHLLEEVRKGRFRRDLYYRLAVFPITIAPLRDHRRRPDIALLAQYFVEHSPLRKEQTNGISGQAIETLMAHDWPGNVRELKNVIDRALILERTAQISPRSLVIETSEPTVEHVSQAELAAALMPISSSPFEPQEAPMSPVSHQADDDCTDDNIDIDLPPAKPMDFSLETAEREFILRALKETGWQRTRAAALLGITRATLHAKLKRYDIHQESDPLTASR